MKCVALQCALADALSLRIYDETISLYDTAEQIRLKLSRLANRDEKPESRRDLLSPREKDVVVCVVKGMTNKQIAERLCLSAHTAITHRRNIAGKLRIHSPGRVDHLCDRQQAGRTRRDRRDRRGRVIPRRPESPFRPDRPDFSFCFCFHRKIGEIFAE